MAGARAQPVRAGLSLLDCVALGINGIVGSGIFLLPGRLAAEAGPASPLAFLACGAVCVLIALCFAELAGAFERSGGAYVYAREAFGDRAGFLVGWMTLCTGVVGYAAVARGLAGQLAGLWPALGTPLGQGLGAAGLIVGLGLLNALGLKAAARTSDALSLIKVVPLLLFTGLGLWHLELARLLAPLPSGAGFGRAVFLALFACSGFEYVAVPAGDADQARQDVPRAIVGALLGATVLYALVQLALVGGAAVAGSGQPLSTAAGAWLGGPGSAAVAAAGAVSMLGFCTSSALIGPRLVVAFADERLLPQPVAALHPRLGTPVRAVALAAGSSALCALLLDFDRLVDLSNVALFAQYLPTCLAVPVLRRTRPDLPRAFRLPGGDLVPALALGASLAMVVAASPKMAELGWSGAVLLVGLGLHALRRRS